MINIEIDNNLDNKLERKATDINRILKKVEDAISQRAEMPSIIGGNTEKLLS